LGPVLGIGLVSLADRGGSRRERKSANKGGEARLGITINKGVLRECLLDLPSRAVS